MDIRKMSLIESPVKNVSSNDMEDYKCGPDKLKLLEQYVKEFLTGEFWEPRYQAWKPYLDTYLVSGVNPQMTAQCIKAFLEKEQQAELLPARNRFTQI